MEELDCIAAVKNQAYRASKTQGLDSKVRVILVPVKGQQLLQLYVRAWVVKCLTDRLSFEFPKLDSIC